MATCSYGMNYGQGWGGEIITQFMSLSVVSGVRLEIGTQIIDVGGVLAVPNINFGIETQITCIGSVQIVDGG